ncbi:hypothetical protein MKW94_013269 [Papaver nudicaule]|uniref:Uncharacterized protein n=1 Tax=Papaver nudicaule TaxID=74823 RepID=A0AA41UXR9_PAPNU|nr:hypothetical protein [Papaver nudicaule]
MGGCASRPKDLNSAPATLPGENTVPEPAIKDVEVETQAEEKKTGDDVQKEEPLVDLSEPTKEPKVETEEPKDAIKDLVSEITVPSDEKKTEELKVEAVNETKEQKPVVAEVTSDEAVKSEAVVVEEQKTEEKKDDAPLVVA